MRRAVDVQINAEQIGKLYKLIQDTGSDLKQFLALFRAGALESLSVRDFYRGIGILQAKQRRIEGKAVQPHVRKRDILRSAPKLIDLIDYSRQLEDGTFSLSLEERDELFLYLVCTMPGTSERKPGRPPESPDAKYSEWLHFAHEVEEGRKRLGKKYGSQTAALRAIAKRKLKEKAIGFDALEKKVEALRKYLNRGPELERRAPMAEALKRFRGK